MIESQVSLDLEAAYCVARKRDAISDRRADQEEQQQNSGDDQEWAQGLACDHAFCCLHLKPPGGCLKGKTPKSRISAGPQIFTQWERTPLVFIMGISRISRV